MSVGTLLIRELIGIWLKQFVYEVTTSAGRGHDGMQFLAKAASKVHCTSTAHTKDLDFDNVEIYSSFNRV